MNFLSAAINTFTGKSIPYSFGDLIEHGDLWKVNKGLNRENKAVTIFSFETDPRSSIPSYSISQVSNGCKIHKMFSVLPGILKLEDFIQNDQGFYLITEPVAKLQIDEYNNEMGVLGLYQILSVLRLIHQKGVSHNGGTRENLLNCIYVNNAGEWKLSGFEKANENAQGNLDSKLVGEAIYNLFKSGGFDHSDAIKISGTPYVHKMPIANLLNGKYTVDQFISEGENNGKWFDTVAIRCYRRFQEFHILQIHEKLELFKAMALCDGISANFLINRGLVEMERTFDTIINQEVSNKGQLLSQLIYLMYLIVNRSSEDSNGQTIFKNCYFKALTVADRTVRLVVLKILPFIVSYVTDYEVQDKIYPSMATGFADTDMTMRTETLSGVGEVIGKITDRQLNNDLLRHLAKLQVDPNPLLRMSVINTLVSISPQMHSNTRPGILITAFGKGLKDSHIKVRITAVNAFDKTFEYFDAETCCSKVVGALAPAMVDKSSHVRKEAQRAMNLCMEKIGNYVETMSDSGELVDEGLGAGPVQVNLEQLGDNLLLDIPDLIEISASKTKTYSSTPTPTPSNNSTPVLSQGRPKPKTKPKPNSSFANLTINDDDNDDDDGWGFNDEEIEAAKPISFKKPIKATPVVKKAPVRKSGLTLGKKSTASKLKVEAKIDDEEDGWGDGW